MNYFSFKSAHSLWRGDFVGVRVKKRVKGGCFSAWLLSLRVSVSCGAAGRCPKACGSTQGCSVPGHWQGNNRPAVGLSTLFWPTSSLSHSVSRLPVWLLHPLLVGRSQAERVCGSTLSEPKCANLKNTDDIKKEAKWKSDLTAEEERVGGGGCRYLLLCCPMLSVICRDKYVSWSLCLQMFSYLIISLPPHLFLTLAILLSSSLTLPVTLARLSVTSAQIQTRLSLTPPTSTVGPAQVQIPSLSNTFWKI